MTVPSPSINKLLGVTYISLAMYLGNCISPTIHLDNPRPTRVKLEMIAVP
jgi:hypothetical protein